MVAISNVQQQLIKTRPNPTLGQVRQIGRVQRRGFRILTAPVPLLTAFVEYPIKQHLGALVIAAFSKGEFGFGRHEAAFAGSFEHGGAVTLEVREHALQRSDRPLGCEGSSCLDDQPICGPFGFVGFARWPVPSVH